MIRRALRVLIVGPFVLAWIVLIFLTVLGMAAIEWFFDRPGGTHARENAETAGDLIAGSLRLVWYGSTAERWS